MEKLDNFGKFLVLMHCDESASGNFARNVVSANFARNVARNDWHKIRDAHFALRDRIIAKMNALNEEDRQGKR